MHSKSLFNFILFCVIALNTSAQTGSGSISGKVLKQQSVTAAFINVSLIKNSDSSLIKTTITDSNGSYTFTNINYGNYLIEISAVGFKKQISKSIILSKSKPEAALPAFILSTEIKNMETVTVVSKKPFIENKIDKTVVNVEASPTSSGLNALEMLEKSPGVTVDNDGNISVKGKSGVVILVDGKSTFLSGQDLTNYLKNLSANQLDQIEIMTQPSAKYDASGNSGS